jgi:DNA-binding response OmpR family regulator
MLPTLIAVIDDDAAICDMITDVLTDSGYPVVCYADHGSFFDELDQVRPTLLILDIRLEHRTNGWEILQKLRSQPTTYDMPIILSTADARFIQQHKAQIHALGAMVLEKPFGIDMFLGTVAQALRGSVGLDADLGP